MIAKDRQQTEQFYQAIGTVEAVFTPGEQPNQGKLIVGDRRYPVWVRFSLVNHLRPGKPQRFRVYPRFFVAENQWSFTVKGIDNRKKNCPNEFTFRGEWRRLYGAPLLQVRQIRREDKPFYLPLNWPEAPEPIGGFWVLQCHFTGREMLVQQAEGPYSLPAPVQPFTPARSSVDKSSNPSAIKTNFPLTVAQVKAMAIPAKVDITCKFSEVPPSLQVAGGVEFYLAQGERILTVRVKPKQFKKLLEHGYSDWIAAVTGQLGATTETGFELENAGIQVFERKPKAI